MCTSTNLVSERLKGKNPGKTKEITLLGNSRITITHTPNMSWRKGGGGREEGEGRREEGGGEGGGEKRGGKQRRNDKGKGEEGGGWKEGKHSGLDRVDQ